jgi:Tfp pilus assembly protein PilZ
MSKCRFCHTPLTGLGGKIMQILFRNPISEIDNTVCKKCELKIERRQFPRFVVEYDSGFKGLETIEFTLANTQDLSEGGVKFISKEKLTKGKALHLKLYIDHLREYIDMIGTVVWSKDVGGDKTLSGIEFRYLNPESKERLRKIIDAFAKRKEHLQKQN